MSTYLFVLCPPYSGSTLLWKLLCTSPHVAALPWEGQFAPELVDVMREGQWKRETRLPWPRIKAVWESYWDRRKPVLLEKSPPNLIRTAEIERHFQPVQFVIMVRNPYAQAEGLMRRNGWQARRAATFATMCLRAQLENRRRLADALTLTYEALVADPAAACARLSAFLPALGPLDHGASFELDSVDGTLDRPITDLNEKKIAALSAEALDTLNDVFAGDREVIEAWGYATL